LNKNLKCGAAASSEPHRNVFADLHKKKKQFSLVKIAFFLHKNGTPAVC
jgi:hypothetical protein